MAINYLGQMENPSYDTTPFKATTVEALWRKNILSEKIPSKEWENFTDRLGDNKIRFQVGLLEMSLLSEKVVLNRVSDCILSPLQTEILATLVPDELIEQPSFQGKPRNKFVGVLMFGDVSGFTALCETYKRMGQSGTYKLTVTLNSYIGAMVDVIYSFGGDIIKFSGDAFLAVWKVTIDDYIYSVIHKAIQCSISIQYSLGSYNTEVNVLLRVKLAISCGNLMFSCIGENNCKYYVIYGQPVDDVKVAQDLCKSGDIILAASAWNHCSLANYLYTWIDRQHIKIDRIVYHPLELHNKIVPMPVRERIDIDKKYRNEILRFKNIGNTDASTETHEEKNCRPEVKKAAERNIGASLRQFVIPPVVAQIDAEQPLDYLTEMRQTTTVFVNLILDKEETSVVDIINRVDDVYTTIWQIVYKEMGVVNKVCMFDKDVMFLVIFGLRGARHEYNAVRSLKCAHRIRSVISKLPGVITISCGVAVGTTYCGVVGHPLRQEYTIIGAPVNKAARLMVYYPNTVSCDQATFFNSGLSSVHFRQQEPLTLKGLGRVTGIYEYLEGQGMAEMKSLQLPVLLGMQGDVDCFRQMLAGEMGFPAGIVYSGETGVGKTRLLTELSILCVDSPLRPVFITLNAAHLKKPYIGLRHLYREIFELSSDTNLSNIADKIENLYKGTELELYVSSLNPVFNLELPNRLPKPNELNESDMLTIQKKLLSKLVELTAFNLAIFIDNMDYCDSKTVEVIQAFLVKGNCLLAMTCNRARTVKLGRFFPGINIIELESLEEGLLPALACQILHVRAIPKSIHLLISNKDDATPGWCQRYLQSLIDSKALQVVKIKRKDIDKMDNMVVPDYKDLLIRVIGQELNPKRIISVDFPALEESFDSEVDVCILESAEAIDETVPASVEALIMSAFDSLQPFEQVLLKCAAVIGDIFPRDFLVAMVQNKSKIMVAEALKRLYDMHILCCNNELQRDKSQSIDSRLFDTNLTVDPVCLCVNAVNIESCNDLTCDPKLLPAYAFCQEIAFLLPIFRRKTYDLLPLNQKHMFHTRAAKYLETLLKSETVVDDIGQSDFKFVDICTAFTYRPLVYDQLIRHTHSGGSVVKEVQCMIEYAEYSILRNSPRRALTHLEKVIRLVEMSEEVRETLNADKVLFKAKTLAAEAHIQLDNSFVAKINIKEAILHQKFVLFNHRFINLKTKINERLVLMELETKGLNRMGGHNHDKALCCIIVCNIKLMDGYLSMARLLALKSVRAILNSRDSSFADLFIALANLLEVTSLLGMFNYCNRILEKGELILNMRIKNSHNTDFVAEEIAIGKYISTAFKVKLFEGKLMSAFEFGKMAELQAEFCEAEIILLRNRCFCILLAIRLKKFEQAVDYLKKLKYDNKEMSLTCYFIFSIYLNLYSGLVEESPHKALEEVHRSIIDLERPLAIVLAVFYIRRDEMYRYKFIDAMMVAVDVTVSNVFFEIMLLEFLLIRLVRKIDAKRWDKKHLTTELSTIASICIELWNVIKDCVISLLPRFYLMMAYIYRIHKSKSLSDLYLNKAELESQKIGDMLEAEWISHNRVCWAHDEDEMFSSWVRHSSRLRHVHWKETESPFYYPLPLPKETMHVSISLEQFHPIFDGTFR